ncbi:hypothetical protein NK6_2344 [Bradyrhizobium diazoefficiens]|uniref:Uncharacterized protein n=2 Tax=Bradyrhizobium diazoefficiens TaxID=1355477 RepID=A0A837C4S6_9BRAD|nr:hypothetical protein BJA5080_05785 [Bradyrhizobium diazoefficiens SEMIA 5080]BAR55525.1 hypothetical protein NK6_2344 [Bradyrhizobium diazoefficiens]
MARDRNSLRHSHGCTPCQVIDWVRSRRDRWARKDTAVPERRKGGEERRPPMPTCAGSRERHVIARPNLTPLPGE